MAEAADAPLASPRTGAFAATIRRTTSTEEFIIFGAADDGAGAAAAAVAAAAAASTAVARWAMEPLIFHITQFVLHGASRME